MVAVIYPCFAYLEANASTSSFFLQSMNHHGSLILFHYAYFSFLMMSMEYINHIHFFHFFDNHFHYLNFLFLLYNCFHQFYRNLLLNYSLHKIYFLFYFHINHTRVLNIQLFHIIVIVEIDLVKEFHFLLIFLHFLHFLHFLPLFLY